MLKHVGLMVTLAGLIGLAMFQPFLPGRYDALAVTLSVMAQLFAFAGLLWLPVAALWLVDEMRRRAAARRGRAYRSWATIYGWVSLGLGGLLALALAVPAAGNTGLSLGVVVLALAAYSLWRAARRLRARGQTGPGGFNATPLYLLLVPLAALGLRQAWLPGAVAFSRSYAIAQSAPFIHDIEAYRAANGHYPASLAALYRDYAPGLIGVAPYSYAPQGEAYIVYFELLAEDASAREVVAYHPHGAPEFTSHDSWIMLLTPAALEQARGYFAVYATPARGWMYFWFD